MSLQTTRLGAALAVFLSAAAATGQEAPRPSRVVPQLPKAATVDGDLKDLKAGVTLTPSPEGAWTGKVGFKKDTLYIGVAAKDDRVLNGDVVEVSVFFPGAGTTAQGYAWRFGPDGLRRPEEGLLPEHAGGLTKAKVTAKEPGLVLELAIPARALPRFPARGPLVFDLCVTYQDRDAPAASPTVSKNCSGGSMQGQALRLPDEFHKALKLKPPQSVTGIEGREHGWVGFAELHYPTWAASDGKMNAPTLRGLVTDKPVDPKTAGINLPEALLLPGGGIVLSVLSGEDPYGVQGKCDADKELRVAFYLVKERTAERVLEWPASTCALGRAAAIEMNEEGELTMGYTNGTTVNFVWSRDHFERTEIGSR